MTDIRFGIKGSIRDGSMDESYREWVSHDPLKRGLIFARPAYPFNALIAEVVVQVGYGKSQSLHTVASTEDGSTGDALWHLFNTDELAAVAINGVIGKRAGDL